MNWKYVKPLESEKLIDDFESLAGYIFPTEFRECVLRYNGGRPERRGFDTDKNAARELKSFLSFNHNDRETMWKIFAWNKAELSNKYIPFAIDNFGNLICFNADNDKVVFVNHENLSIELIADTFSEFIEVLYE